MRSFPSPSRNAAEPPGPCAVPLLDSSGRSSGRVHGPTGPCGQMAYPVA